MGVDYKPVIWNRNKYIYDAVLVVAVAAYIYLYIRVGVNFQDTSLPVERPVMRMRAFGSCAFLMLSFILCIGPLSRMNDKFLPLLYNRRHFGVLTACVAAVHANYVLGWYFAFSPTDRYAALFSSNTSFGQVLGFPFEVFGIFAFVMLLILAVTSHDFWLSFLSPPVWKKLHMGIYFGYAAVVLHVALGPLQTQRDPVFAIVFFVCVAAVSFLHFWAAMKDRKEEAEVAKPAQTSDDIPWIEAGKVSDIVDKRAIVVSLPDEERVAIFRNGETLSAVHNVCAHQNGPLGEGKIVAGCITCPWHGFQYKPEDGRSPAPFEEKISTYRLRLEGETVFLDPRPLPPGTFVKPTPIGDVNG
ncbi:MAG: Rieske 2Fe-2S domain-containing protein [Pseudomonadota bacterium]